MLPQDTAGLGAKLALLESELKAAKTFIAAQEKMLDNKNRQMRKMRELFQSIIYVAHYTSRQTIIEIAEVGQAVLDEN